jgi:spore coat polysaccharide biosynthesis protein SpsF
VSRTLVVVQARTGSGRLPGKVLLPLAGAPVLLRQIERILAARTPFDLVVATTTRPEDDRIADLARRFGVRVFRGDETDLLDRHYRAAEAAGAEVVVKIPSDCPLIDPDAIDRVLQRFLTGPDRPDYASNLHPASWPDGNDVEAMSMEALATAWREAGRDFEREHTTPFLWERPERFRIANVQRVPGEDLSMSLRFTLDYPDDYVFVTAIYEARWRRERPVFPLEAILRLLQERPALRELNARYAGVNWYRHHLGELRTVSAAATRRPGGEPAAPRPEGTLS